MARVPGSGAMTEQLAIMANAPPTLSVTSLTRIGSVATVVTSDAHEYLTGDYVTIAGATPSGYNARVKVTVTGATTFTYPTSSALATPASGTITARYASDAQAGQRKFWEPVATIYGEMIPLRASERLQREAVQSSVDYRFRVYERDDITAKMRAIWTPSWGAAARTLEIVGGPLPCEDGRTFMYLEMSDAGA